MTSPLVSVGRLRGGEWIALAVAFCWSLGLLVAALRLPVYEGESETSPGHVVRHHTATLVEVNGLRAMLIVGIPLLVTLVVGLALWLGGTHSGAGPIAWAGVVVLAAFNILGMMTIGLFVVPVTGCLVVACALRQSRASGG